MHLYVLNDNSFNCNNKGVEIGDDKIENECYELLQLQKQRSEMSDVMTEDEIFFV